VPAGLIANFFSWWQSFDTGGSHRTLEAATGHWRQPWQQIVVFSQEFSCSDFSSSYSQVDCSLCFWLHASSMQAVLLLLVVIVVYAVVFPES